VPRLIAPIRIPTPVVREIPPPATRDLPRPVIAPPVLEVPNPVIEYPTIDVPTQEEWRGQLGQEQEKPVEEPTDNRDLPPPAPTGPVVELPVVGEVPLPPVAPLVTAGATAVVAATVTMGATILLNQIKGAVLDPLLKRMNTPKKNKKIKIKQVKPVLHFVEADDEVQVFEYNAKGTRFVDRTNSVESYLRDNIEEDALYEYDNKIIIDDTLKSKFTKEGQKRFGKLFCPAKSIVKKLSAKLSL